MDKKVTQIFDHYLSKYTYPIQFKQPIMELSPDMIVVIPCYNEKDLDASLLSLLKADSENLSIGIIVVVNASEKENSDILLTNQNTIKSISDLQVHNLRKPNFEILWIDIQNLPEKDAGVGLARKIGMDWAITQFKRFGKDGIIICFDADTLCNENYFQAIQNAYRLNQKMDVASIYFEHPISGNNFNKEVYDAIVLYELHLRLFVNFQKICGLPFAYQTIGSSMCVRASAYCRFGGMNKRKAGEDFYFMQKIIDQGFIGEINDTVVIPSPRISDRVPFGTGKAVGDILNYKNGQLKTYNPKSYYLLIELISKIPSMFTDEDFNLTSLPLVLEKFFLSNNIDAKIREIKNNTSTQYQFTKRFFQWFNAFSFMKYMHYMRDNGFPDVALMDAGKSLAEKSPVYFELISCEAEKDMLIVLRNIDRNYGRIVGE